MVSELGIAAQSSEGTMRKEVLQVAGETAQKSFGLRSNRLVPTRYSPYLGIIETDDALKGGTIMSRSALLTGATATCVALTTVAQVNLPAPPEPIRPAPGSPAAGGPETPGGLPAHSGGGPSVKGPHPPAGITYPELSKNPNAPKPYPANHIPPKVNGPGPGPRPDPAEQ